MTCASCANRIERKLNKMDGVIGDGQLRDGEGEGRVPDGPGPGRAAAHRRAGRLQRGPAPPGPGGARERDETADDPTRSLRQRLIISAVLTVPVVALAMVPAWQFDYWQWLSLTLAAPVVVWGAWPFHRAAWTNLRHGTSTMDTLISIGTLGGPRVVALRAVLGDCRRPGHDPRVRAHRGEDRRVGQHLPRGRGRRDDIHPRGPLLRGPVEAARRRCAAGPARAGRQGRRGAARRAGRAGRGAHPHRAARGRRPLRGPSRREDRHRRAGRRGQLRSRRLDAHR